MAHDPLALFTERFPRDPEQPLGAPHFPNGLWRRLVAQSGILPLCPLDPNAPHVRLSITQLGPVIEIA